LRGSFHHSIEILHTYKSGMPNSLNSFVFCLKRNGEHICYTIVYQKVHVVINLREPLRSISKRHFNFTNL
jgi:hypothetical protein